MARLAALLTCHNRRDSTLSCLEVLFRQQLPSGTTLTAYLVDDGSSDGTGDAVRARFPQVTVLAGDGNLFWCGGMRLAWSEAMKEGFDFYLWLNDDTILFPGAVATLLETFQVASSSDASCGIVIGSTCDPVTGHVSYGGFGDPAGNCRVLPSEREQQCATMNGNIVLVAHKVPSLVGNLSATYRHTHGDMEYGLRARRRGFTLWLAPHVHGYCSPNRCPSWCDPLVPLAKRLRALHSPKGMPPREMITYARQYLPWWPLVLCKLYARVLWPRRYHRLKQLLKA